MRYASAKLLQSSNVKSYSITLVCMCVCVIMKNEEISLFLKKNGQLEKAIHVHKNPPMRKKKALTFENEK